AAISGHQVWFHDGWLMRRPFKNGAYQAVRPGVSVHYVDADGSTALMSVVQNIVDGKLKRQFLLSKVVNGAVVSDVADTWTFKVSSNETRTVELVEKPPLTPEVNVL